MSTEKQSVEITAESLEEAIDQGLAELDRARSEVEIEILDEGTKGLFGLGSKEASVRLTVLSPDESQDEDESEDAPESEAFEDDSDDYQAEDDEEDDDEDEEDEEDEDEDDEDYLLDIARSIVEDLLDNMHVRANVSATYVESDADSRRPRILVEVTGDDLSYLIGRRAETLNALQYISRLILGKELGRSISLNVDIQGYRARRMEQLERIAHQMADQAVASGRRQSLEPMPADERRIIHISLRENEQVSTESSGEGNRRKVTIFLND
jgi:spoIIIJ-associated protein